MVKLFGLLTFAAALLMSGVSCCFFPRKIQALAIKAAASGSMRIAILERFMHSNYYLINLRFVGVLSLACSVFIVWMLLKNS